MRRLFAIFLFLPFLSFGAVRGYMVRITLSLYRSSLIGYSSSTGEPMFTGAYTGAKKYVWKYVSGSFAPTMASMGLTQYHDIEGNPIPASPYHSEFDFYVVTSVNNFIVDDTVTPVPSNIGLPNGFDSDVPWMTPIYDISGGNPITFEGSSVTGANNSFGAGGSLAPLVLQGQISSGNNGGDVPQYLYYSPYGSPTFSVSDNGGYQFVYDPSSGQYSLELVQSPSSSGSVDLSPVVDAIEMQGGYTRQQLLDLLGASGSSWVYDCRLSLSQLYDLATSSGLIVTLPFNSQLDEINSSVLSVDSTLGSKEYCPELGS